VKIFTSIIQKQFFSRSRQNSGDIWDTLWTSMFWFWKKDEEACSSTVLTSSDQQQHLECRSTS